MLEPTEIWAETTWIGVIPDRAQGFVSEPRAAVSVDYRGFEGDAYAGLTRPSCSRVKKQYARGTEIRNARQLSIVSTEELAAIGAAMGLGEPLAPAWIGANLAVSGVPELSRLPPSARLIFEDGPALVIDIENGPCRQPGAVIDRAHPGKGKFFAKQALGRRGVVAWVERPGRLALGDRCRLHVPPQRLYAPAAGAV